ncbi:MAG TPA: hypothetical protein VGG11_09450 [Xanthobacteraceae bacterium]|jgi:hypothetical protein
MPSYHAVVIRWGSLLAGGRLNGGGRALLKEALQAGMSHVKLARLFDITPAAVAYHDR